MHLYTHFIIGTQFFSYPDKPPGDDVERKRAHHSLPQPLLFRITLVDKEKRTASLIVEQVHYLIVHGYWQHALASTVKHSNLSRAVTSLIQGYLNLIYPNSRLSEPQFIAILL